MSESPHDYRNHAGAYGFTRREIFALAAIAALSIAVILYSEWRDRKSQSPGWVIEDVLIEAPSSVPTLEAFKRNLFDTAATQAPRDYSDLIDINTADVRELSRLPGIGSELGRRIIEEREANGSFVNLTDLQRVRGIGARKAATLSGWIKFSGQTSADDSGEAP
jgi:competence ComEA-like helix-hairpin-helix protein